MPQPTRVQAVYAELEDRLNDLGDTFDGDTIDPYTWALICELFLPERFKAPPVDPRGIPAMFAGDPESRVLVMADRHAEGFAIHSPRDAKKPDWADGTRGLAPDGSALTAKQGAVNPGNRGAIRRAPVPRPVRPGVG